MAQGVKQWERCSQAVHCKINVAFVVFNVVFKSIIVVTLVLVDGELNRQAIAKVPYAQSCESHLLPIRQPRDSAVHTYSGKRHL